MAWQVVKPEGILASNTSSISITRIAAVTLRPEQVVQGLRLHALTLCSKLNTELGRLYNQCHSGAVFLGAWLVHASLARHKGVVSLIVLCNMSSCS